MKTLWLDETLTYDGSQLRPHWILGRTGLVGDALVGFRGPCRVRAEAMVDVVDLQAGAVIAGDDMVHLIWESFAGPDLLLAVHRQRLLAAQAGECLRELVPQLAGLRREGDDLYVGPGKLSVSVATRGPISALIHFAVNVRPGGAPVPVAALADWGVAPDVFGRRLLAAVAAEQCSIEAARATVRAPGAGTA